MTNSPANKRKYLFLRWLLWAIALLGWFTVFVATNDRLLRRGGLIVASIAWLGYGVILFMDSRAPKADGSEG